MDNELLIKNIVARFDARGEKPTPGCAAAGVGSTFLSKIRKGQTPSVEKISMLADYLDCSVDELLTGTPPAKPTRPMEQLIMDKVAQLGEADQAKVYARILEMLEEKK